MDTTSDTKKNIKKRTKVKQSSSKNSDLVSAGSTEGHSHQNETKKQANEETKVKKKSVKVRRNSIRNIDPQNVIPTVDQAPQECNRTVTKKKPKVKTVSNIEPIKVVQQLSQPLLQKTQNEAIKVVQNLEQSAHIESIETLLGSPQNSVPDIDYYHKKSYLFIKTLKRDYKRLALIYNACIKAERDRERRNEEEIDQLKKTYHEMQVTCTEIKRKRWCRYCESEATYLSSCGINFFCSAECEKKQNDLVTAMGES